MINTRLNSTWWALRIGLGLGPLLAGLDKFFNLLADWPSYLSPVAVRLLPVAPATFMHVVGIIEIAVGIGILTRWTRPFAYVAMVWLWCIAMNLLLTGRYFDVAVRDVEMSIAAFALARLTEAREGATAYQPAAGSKIVPRPSAA